MKASGWSWRASWLTTGTDIRTISSGATANAQFSGWALAFSPDAVPFDRLIGLAQQMPGGGGERLLMEMIRRFSADASA